MADVPDKSDPNPFSFKTFMKRGEGPAAPPPPPAGTKKKSGVKKKGSAKKESGESLPGLEDDNTGKPEGIFVDLTAADHGYSSHLEKLVNK